ncbi:MAG: type I-U CRISPR-associated protein Csx17 [Pyrinomonadaceae bacterium]
MTHIIKCHGCTPEPLAAYLKALAVLRLVCKQADPQAKGWWQGDVLHLETSIDQKEFVRFFLEKYSPTPIVAPWNGGSGFHEGDDITGREAIRASVDNRFSDYRQTINDILAFPELPAIDELTIADFIARVEIQAAKLKGKKREDLLRLVTDTETQINHVSEILKRDALTRMTIKHLEAEKKLPKSVTKDDKERSKAIGNLLKPVIKLRTAIKQERRATGKDTIVRACRNRLNDRTVEWIDAAVSILDNEKDKLGFPPLLMSGGIEGRLEYSNSFMEYAAQLLLEDKNGNSETLLRNALFGTPTSKMVRASVGQHNPSRAGGYNQGQGIEEKNFPMNPWDFVLTLEGTLAWASGVARRQSTRANKRSCSPFTVNARAVGYSSSADSDAGKARAEIWTPLWNRPVGYDEIHALLKEGRAEVKGRQASHSIEFAEAVASLGVDRGITEFVRYSLLKRRGDSYIALPAGRFPVTYRSESDLVRNLNPLLSQVDYFLRSFKNEPPARFISRRRDVDSAIYQVLLRGGATNVKGLVRAVGRLEQLFAERDLSKEPKLQKPLFGLNPKWLLAADDGSVEVRIAAALASIQRTGDVGSLRSNLAPIDPKQPYSWSKDRGQTAWTGNSLSARLAATLQRRMMDAARLDCQSNPLWGAVSLRAADIASLIEADINETVVEELLFGFSLIRWDEADAMEEVGSVLKERWAQPVVARPVLRSWALLKHLFLPHSFRRAQGERVTVKPELSAIPLLRANRVSDACKIAARRLFVAGLNPTRATFPDSGDGTRLAAALIIPVRRFGEVSRLVLTPSQEKQ